MIALRSALRRLAATMLAPFPSTHAALARVRRAARTRLLRARHPAGGFLVCNGARVFCDFENETYAWYDGDSEYLAYELAVFTSLLRLEAPDVVLDVGAHWGFYPAFLDASPLAADISRLLVVEADPRCQPLLGRTLASLHRLQVERIDAAISEVDGEIELHWDGALTQTYRSDRTVASHGRVPALTLDTLVRRHLRTNERLTHVKLDIDGAEPAFFAGGTETLRTMDPIVMMEFWARGLLASHVDVAAFWSMLQARYFVSEASFSGRAVVPLRVGDLPALVEKTRETITNLVLLPRRRSWPDIRPFS
jgi:FkbM family methyltransferase